MEFQRELADTRAQQMQREHGIGSLYVILCPKKRRADAIILLLLAIVKIAEVSKSNFSIFNFAREDVSVEPEKHEVMQG